MLHETRQNSSVSTQPVGAARATPFVAIDRQDWARLSVSTPLPLTATDVEKLRGLGERIDLAEVDDVYRPISRLLNIYAEATQSLHSERHAFLTGQRETRTQPTPFVIGIAGSVAVGKSTTARILREMLARWPSTPKVELVTTDGFLFPNAELQRRGLMTRKGFPDSYDRRALLRFVANVKAGVTPVEAPVYSHLTYDVLTDQRVCVNAPDVLIVEGLNVLQPARPGALGRRGVAISDFFDFSIYVDARTPDIKRWYQQRFLRLRETAFADPDSYFHRYAALSDAEAHSTSSSIWDQINGPNLEDNIRPTRGRATLILQKGPDHKVERVLLRKL
ncbi:type I pantothenate kinase [Micrococcales bacterium 31B]|nr:type I pantothenate kinase [Micrococcales bacterium 31B]